MEAASIQAQASQNPMSQAGKARMVTRTIGFRLGPLEVDYSTRQVEFDASRFGQAGQDSRSAPHCDASAAGDEVSARLAAARGETAANHPDPLWRRALTAYARAAGQAGQDPDQTSPLLTAVG